MYTRFFREWWEQDPYHLFMDIVPTTSQWVDCSFKAGIEFERGLRFIPKQFYEAPNAFPWVFQALFSCFQPFCGQEVWTYSLCSLIKVIVISRSWRMVFNSLNLSRRGLGKLALSFDFPRSKMAYISFPSKRDENKIPSIFVW